MGYALTAIADDAFANYYNCAGLVYLGSPTITASYLGYLCNLWLDAHYAYLAISYPVGNSGLGFDFTFFTPDEAEKRDSLGHYLGTERVWRIAPRISYARRLIDRLSLGVAWKYIHERYHGDPYWWGGWYDSRGVSWAFDFNVLYKPLENLSIGAVLHNIGPNIKYTMSGATDPLPRLTRVALAYVPSDNRYIKCTLCIEITKILVGMFADEDNTFWQNMKYELDAAWKGFGLELLCYRVFSLRGGYFYDFEGRRDGFTFGLGAQIKGFALDIGIDEVIFDFPTQNRTVSVSYRFN